MTTYGPMVEVTNFLNTADNSDGNINVRAAMQLPTTLSRTATSACAGPQGRIRALDAGLVLRRRSVH